MTHKFLSIISLLTRIPIKLSHEPDYSSSALFFPLTGLLLSIVIFLPALLFSLIIRTPLLLTFIILISQYLTANLFHLDGLMDTADASGVFGSKEKRYEVLKDSRIGVYGFFAGTAILGGKFLVTYLLVSNNILDTWASYMLAMVFSRYASILITNFTQPVNQSGLAVQLGKPSVFNATISVIACSLLPLILFMRNGNILAASISFFLTGVSAVLTAGYLSTWYAKNIGGYNGDAMGAVIELTELFSLIGTCIVFN